MRKLLWFALGFGLSCAGCGGLGANAWCLWAAAFAGLAAFLGFFCRKNRRRAAVCLLGCCLGLLWCYGYDRIFLSTVREADGSVRPVEIELYEYPAETRYGASVKGYLRLEGKRYKTLVYLRDFPENAEPGDRISLCAELRVTAEGGAREPTYHRTEGIYLLAYPESGASLEKAEKFPARYYPARWRRWIGSQVERCFPEDVQGFVQALLLGDKTNLAAADRNNLSLTGLSHLVAVSGLHISILFGAIQLLTRKRRALTAAVGIPAVLLFAAVVGFTPSVTRAALMECLIMLGLLLNREYDPPTALGFSGLVILLWNPLTICSAGFQLSFASVAGIFLFYDKINGWLQAKSKPTAGKGKRLRSRLFGLLTRNVAICLSVSVLTTPFLAYYFGAVSLLAPLVPVDRQSDLLSGGRGYPGWRPASPGGKDSGSHRRVGRAVCPGYSPRAFRLSSVRRLYGQRVCCPLADLFLFAFRPVSSAEEGPGGLRRSGCPGTVPGAAGLLGRAAPG